MNQEHIDIILLEIRTESYNNKTMQEAYDLLHTNTITNTVEVPITITIQNLLGMLSSESLAKLVSWPSLPDLRDKILSGDRNGIILWGQLLMLGGIITQNEFNGIYAYINQTEEKQVVIETVSRLSIISAGVPNFPNKIGISDFETIWNLR